MLEFIDLCKLKEHHALVHFNELTLETIVSKQAPADIKIALFQTNFKLFLQMDSVQSIA